ncbi:MAG: hypothetical protein R2941_15910 [Desulfobacterales bacterium]
MFGILRKSAPSSPWLGSDEWLFTLKLSKVENPLDPSPLWDSRYGGGRQIWKTAPAARHCVCRMRWICTGPRFSGKDSRGWRDRRKRKCLRMFSSDFPAGLGPGHPAALGKRSNYSATTSPICMKRISGDLLNRAENLPMRCDGYAERIR